MFHNIFYSTRKTRELQCLKYTVHKYQCCLFSMTNLDSDSLAELFGNISSGTFIQAQTLVSRMIMMPQASVKFK